MFEALRNHLRKTGGAEVEIRGIHVACWSDPGKLRSANEDSVHAHTSGDGFAFAMVADGMGGAQGGKTASEMAVRSVPQHFQEPPSSPERALRKALESASNEIYRASCADTSLEGMGTTCVAMLIQDGKAWAAWVGDSRLYLIREGRLFQMTEDHSVVQEMVRAGRLTPEQAREHEDRNIVTRALGSHDQVEVAVWDAPFPVRPGDRFLLCSDGLHDVVPEPDMLTLASRATIQVSCGALVNEANARGGPDNISAVLVEVAMQVSSAPVAATRQVNLNGEEPL
jgi:protein phosphatase